MYITGDIFLLNITPTFYFRHNTAKPLFNTYLVPNFICFNYNDGASIEDLEIKLSKPY